MPYLGLIDVDNERLPDDEKRFCKMFSKDSIDLCWLNYSCYVHMESKENCEKKVNKTFLTT